MNKKVTQISAVALIAGLSVQLNSLFVFSPNNIVYNIAEVLKYIFPKLDFNFFNQWDLFHYVNPATRNSFSFFDFCFYILLLVGLISYVRTKGKELRLLRMSFAVIFYAKMLTVINSVVWIFAYWLNNDLKTHVLASPTSLSSILLLISNIAWIYLAYYTLRTLSMNIELFTKKEEGEEDMKMIETPQRQRFAHHIIDNILNLIISTKVFYSILASVGFMHFIYRYGERISIFIIITISSLIYYTFFETMFGATPAKFFTGSRVVKVNGDKLGFETSFLRSLSRHVPFEPFSYLGGENGWHDKWQGTKVVKEETSGLPIRNYLRLIPLLSVILLIGYFSPLIENMHHTYYDNKKMYDTRIENITYKLDQLTPDCFIGLRGVRETYPYGRAVHFLKPISIKEDKVICHYFKIDKMASKSFEIERYYEEHKNDMPEISVTKENLKKSYVRSYQKYRNNKRVGAAYVPNDNTNYTISEIYNAYGPNLSTDGRSGGLFQDGTFRLPIRNDGWPGKITEIEYLKGGDLNLLNRLPIKLESSHGESSSSGKTVLQFNKYRNNTTYEFTITVLDSTSQKHIYLIEGRNRERKIRRLSNEGD